MNVFLSESTATTSSTLDGWQKSKLGAFTDYTTFVAEVAVSIAARIRTGVVGVIRTPAPRFRSASFTTLQITATETIARPSPIPYWPK